MDDIFEMSRKLFERARAGEPVLVVGDVSIPVDSSVFADADPVRAYVAFAAWLFRKVSVSSTTRSRSDASPLSVGLQLHGGAQTFIPGGEIPGYNPNASSTWAAV